MLRKFTIKVVLVLSVFACAFGLFACTEKGDDNSKPSETHTHSYANYEYNNDATCGQDGTETGKCLYCDATDTHTKKNTATGAHEFGDDDFCDVCGYDKSIPVGHKHTLYFFTEQAATCTTDGSVEYWQCESCQKYFSDSDGLNEIKNIVIKKLNHDIVSHIAQAATCTEKGWNAYVTCSRCDYTTYNEIAALGHDEQSHIAQAATCTEKGWNAYVTCSRCDYTTYSEIDVVEHTLNDLNFCIICQKIYGTPGLNYSLNNDRRSYSVTGIGTAQDSDIYILSKYNDKPVTSVGDRSFYEFSNLTSIKIPNSVTSIGEYAFYGCNSLTRIEIPNSVTSIGEFAFDNCSSLINITVADNNPNYSSQDGILYNKNKTKFIHVPIAIEGNITIPSSITKIDGLTFADCRNLKGIEIPNSVTSIGEAAFFGCSSLTSITMPLVGDENSKYYKKYLLGELFGSNSYVGGVKTSQNYYTGGTSYYGTYYIPATLRSVTITGGIGLDRSTFFNCSGLTSIKILKNITRIEGYAFAGCSGLTNLEIPSSVTSIGEYAFHTCSSLTSIEIPNKVTQIGWLAFFGCSSLTNIIVPNSVTSISDSAFKGCSSLTIYCEVSSKPSGWNNDWNKDNECAVVWNYRNNNKDNNGYIYRVIDGVRYSLKDGEATVIRQPRDLSCIVLPNSVIYNGITYYVISISDNAFNDCISLTSVTIPENISNIGADVFKNCSSLTIYCETKSKPNGWSNDWNKNGCPVIWNYKNNDKDNNGYAYSVIDGIRYRLKNRIATVISQPKNVSLVSLPSSVVYKGITYYVTSISDNAFYHCTSLVGITVSNGIKTIGKNAFNGCSSLTRIEIPNSVTSIGDLAFDYCSSLTRIEIPNSVTSIGDYAFRGCSSLTSIEIPNSVTSIGRYAFQSCSRLMSVTIPVSVTSIGGSTFSGCSNLTSINVAHGNTKYHSLGNCLIETATKTLIAGCNNSVIPTNGSVTIIGESAFSYYSSLTSIEIPNSVTSIGICAFSDCSSLTSIEIPNSVTSIGDWAFAFCYKLTSINFKGTKAQWEAISKSSSWDSCIANYTITCTDGSLSKSES